MSASAGSGKTYRLAYKFVHDTIKHFQAKPYLYRAILAVTFTNKATEEMKSRILKEINDLVVKPQESNYLDDLKKHLGLSEAEISKRAKAIRTKILHDYISVFDITPPAKRSGSPSFASRKYVAIAISVSAINCKTKAAT